MYYKNQFTWGAGGQREIVSKAPHAHSRNYSRFSNFEPTSETGGQVEIPGSSVNKSQSLTSENVNMFTSCNTININNSTCHENSTVPNKDKNSLLSDTIQSRNRSKITGLGYFVPLRGQTCVGYAKELLLLAETLKPPFREKELVDNLLCHFPREIRQEIRKQKIETIDQLLKLLHKFDKDLEANPRIMRQTNITDTAKSCRHQHHIFGGRSDGLSSLEIEERAQSEILSECDKQPHHFQLNNLNNIINGSPKNQKNVCQDPFIFANLGKVKVDVLIDKHADITCISEDFYNKNEFELMTFRTSKINQVAINGAQIGRSILTLFQITIPTTFENGFKYNITYFVLPGLKINCILGRDSIADLEMNIFPNHHLISIKNVEKPLEICGLGLKIGLFYKSIRILTHDEFGYKFSENKNPLSIELSAQVGKMNISKLVFPKEKHKNHKIHKLLKYPSLSIELSAQMKENIKTLKLPLEKLKIIHSIINTLDAVPNLISHNTNKLMQIFKNLSKQKTNRSFIINKNSNKGALTDFQSTSNIIQNGNHPMEVVDHSRMLAHDEFGCNNPHNFQPLSNELSAHLANFMNIQNISNLKFSKSLFPFFLNFVLSSLDFVTLFLEFVYNYSRIVVILIKTPRKHVKWKRGAEHESTARRNGIFCSDVYLMKPNSKIFFICRDVRNSRLEIGYAFYIKVYLSNPKFFLYDDSIHVIRGAPPTKVNKLTLENKFKSSSRPFRIAVFDYFRSEKESLAAIWKLGRLETFKSELLLKSDKDVKSFKIFVIHDVRITEIIIIDEFKWIYMKSYCYNIIHSYYHIYKIVIFMKNYHQSMKSCIGSDYNIKVQQLFRQFEWISRKHIKFKFF